MVRLIRHTSRRHLWYAVRSIAGHLRHGAGICNPVTVSDTQAEPRRVARVSKQLEREIGNLFLYDKVAAVVD